MAPVSPTSAGLGDPELDRAASRDAARKIHREATVDALDRLDLQRCLLLGRTRIHSLSDGRSSRCSPRASQCGAGWWFYRDNAGDRSENTTTPVLAEEVQPTPKQGYEAGGIGRDAAAGGGAVVGI